MNDYEREIDKRTKALNRFSIALIFAAVLFSGFTTLILAYLMSIR